MILIMNVGMLSPTNLLEHQVSDKGSRTNARVNKYQSGHLN